MENQIIKQEENKLAIQMRNTLQQWQNSVEQVRSLMPSKKVSSLTIATALESPQVSFVANELGHDYVSVLFVKAMNEICIMTNTVLSAEAVVLIADIMVTDYWYLRIDEVLMVMGRGLKGYYGQTFKNINAQVIFEWLNKHEQERNNHFYDNHLKLKNSIGNPGDRSPDPKLAKDVFEQMVDQKVNFRIEKYKEAAKEKKTWTDVDTQNAITELNK